ncbi:MAG TPA: ATP-binding protein [Clostridiales bacterium]|nr:ATP-binding protein [Clostridiales bacterium]HPV01768.1 ATP-binding protein [Clostridiales bacterium]
MFKSIFSKLIAIFLLILAVAFAVTGMMMNIFLYDYVTDEKAATLEEAGNWVNNVFRFYINLIDLSDYSSLAYAEMLLNDTLVNYGKYTSSYIWIVNQDGYLYRSNWDMPASIAKKYIDDTGYIRINDPRNFSKLTESPATVREVGDFNGFFKDPYFSKMGDVWLTVARSFKYEFPGGNSMMIVIYLHTPVQEVSAARRKVLKYFLTSGGIAIAVSVVMIYIFSLRLSRPLKQLKYAAARISNGEFEKRVNIKSRDEIGELARAFNQMASALENIEKMRRGFVANVSHELRTPMTSIRGFIEGILDGTIPPEKHDHYLTIVRDETNRLNRLVTDLLDLAKMESGEMKLNITDFDINELIRKCVIKLETLILEKDLNVDADFEEEDLMVSGDPDAIERVVYNLMHNAIKFTPAGGKISIITKSMKDTAEITIRDTGIGIDESELGMIWDRFYKSDKSRSRDKTGTGLGLAIVRNIINEHGQRISVQSKLGEGTAFTFTLAKAGGTSPDKADKQ